MKTGISDLETIFQAFVNGRFSKRHLYKLCKEKGYDVKGNKEALVAKVMELYSPEKLAEASRIIQLLRWHERLILSILLSHSETKKEISEHELIQRVFSRGVPEAAFGTITSKTLNLRESCRRLDRKVNGLEKKHLLLVKKRGRSGIYSIHSWFLPYFKKKLRLPSEEQVTKQIQEQARSTIRFSLIDDPTSLGFNIPELRAKLLEGVICEWAEKKEKGPIDLRSGLAAVKASWIATQYYCEKKVELTQIHGRKETPKMRLGTETHEKLLEDTVKAKTKEVWAKIAFGIPTTVREMPLIGKYENVILMGQADSVYFNKGVPELLLEYKFTKSRRPWRDYHVQARVYCLLLHLMGFNTEELKYAFILVPPECKVKRELRGILKTILSNPEKDMIEEKVNALTVRIYVTDFEMDPARQDLHWALGFWKKERAAIPTRKAGKCATCEFKQTCPDSLTRQSSASG